MTSEEFKNHLLETSAINSVSLVILADLFRLSHSLLFEVLEVLNSYDSFNEFLSDCKTKKLPEIFPEVYEVLITDPTVDLPTQND